MRVPTILAMCVAVVSGAQARLDMAVSPQGVLSFADGTGALCDARIFVHGPEWTTADQASAVGVTRAADGSLTGRVTMPANSKGELRFREMPEAAGPGRADAGYDLGFSDDSPITGAYVSFLLPVARFKGRTVRAIPGETELALPVEAGGIGDLVAPGLTIDLGAGKQLLLASSLSGSIHLQDNRQYGSDFYEVRFILVGGPRVFAGETVTRAFTVAIASRGEADQIVSTLAPQKPFDRSKPYAIVGEHGGISLAEGDDALGSIAFYIHGSGWEQSRQEDARDVASVRSPGSRAFSGWLPVPRFADARMDFSEMVTVASDRELSLAYRFRSPQAVSINGCQVSFMLPASRLAGEKVAVADGKGTDVSIPPKLDRMSLFTGQAREVRVAPGRADGFLIRLDQPSQLLIQDNRQFGSDEIELRFNFVRPEDGGKIPAGWTAECTFVVAYNAPVQVVLDERTATDRTDTSNWITFTLPWDDVPIDVSFLNDKPAGKHGFLTVKGDQFVFEDGTPVRFWGTCFSAGANFPSHEQAEKIARRLAKSGVNIVRTHHADASWAERCFFDKQYNDTQHFDRENLDRFDYLMYCLKQNGIYVYLDQLVNRKFLPGDNVDAVDELPVCGKPYSNFDPRLIELQKKYSHDLWTHVNPYTKLRFCDDPMFVLMEFANENDLFTQQVTLEPYRSRLEDRYRKWAAEHGVELGPDKVDFTRKTDPMMRFLIDVQHGYYADMHAYLRSIGVRIPMTGSNWSRNAALLVALRDMDYTDSHTYWDHPQSGGGFSNRPMVAAASNVFGGLSFNRLYGKPFFVSEWDEPWPNEWRAEMTLPMAAVSAFQGWNGLTVYTYRHSSSTPIDRLSGAFETFNDPDYFGIFPHAALIFRRADVSAARETRDILISREDAESAASLGAWGLPALNGTPEVHRLEMALFEPPPDRIVIPPDKPTLGSDVHSVASDTGQLYRDWQRRIGTMDAPRTQVAYGFLGGAGALDMANLRLRIDTPFAVVALSSLTDQPIGSSSRMLLTAVGRAENTGFAYNLTHTRTVDAGTGPILIEPIVGEVSIATTRANLRVRSLGADGRPVADVPATYADGRLTFRIGPEGKSMYYELTGE